jgi:hypothetical protein
MKRANSSDYGDATPYGHSAPVGLSGGTSNKPSRARQAGKQFPRPSVEDKSAPAPMGLSMPAPNAKSGGSGNMSKPRSEGTGVGYGSRKFTPKDKMEAKPLSQVGMGPGQPMSGASAASKNPDGKPKRWVERGYDRGNPRLEGEE